MRLDIAQKFANMNKCGKKNYKYIKNKISRIQTVEFNSIL